MAKHVLGKWHLIRDLQSYNEQRFFGSSDLLYTNSYSAPDDTSSPIGLHPTSKTVSFPSHFSDDRWSQWHSATFSLAFAWFTKVLPVFGRCITKMGNRSCNGVLCYDVDPGRSVDESTVPSNSRKFSSICGTRQEVGEFIHEDDYIFHPRGKRRFYREDTISPAASPVYKMKRMLSDDKTKTLTTITSSNVEPPVAHDRPYSYHCRTMSSETAGREARTEHSLSHRSSTTTCEREDVQDDILSNRSS